LKVGIVGLGLMGGSLAKALRKYSIATKIFGFVKNKEEEKQILEFGLVDELLSFEELKTKVDILILALPVKAIISYMQDLKDIDENLTIIDLGSTKEEIILKIPKNIRKNFVAAHPMAGTENSGPSAAIDNLYEGNTVVLCNLEDNSKNHKNKALKLFRQIGMRIVQMDAKSHDIHASYISHLPHAISFSLANTVMNHENPQEIIALAVGGFKDMSRIAKSSPNMWSDVFFQNKKNLLKSLNEFEKNLKNLKELVENDKEDELKELMRKANSLHNIL